MTEASTTDFKQREHDSWAAVADGWCRQDALLRKGSAPVTERMLSLAGISAGHKVLDIASGTGEPAISTAKIVGDGGRVIGTDLTDEMLAYARQKADHAGLKNIEFRCVDGETLDIPRETIDAVTIRWGLMFMPEPQTCLTLAHGAMRPGARISVACWSGPEKNPFVSLLIKILGQYIDLPKPPPGSPGIFAMADPQRLREVMESSGFKSVNLEELEIDVVEVENGQAYWEAMSDLAAPVMRMVDQMDNNTRGDYINEVINAADAMKQGNTLRMRGTTWIASAEK